MRYEKSLLAKWTDYAVLKTVRDEGREEGEEKKSYKVVKKLLAANKFTMSEIANLADVTEAFIRKVKKTSK